MDKINKTSDSSCWQDYGVGGALIHWGWECRLLQPLWKSVWQSLRKIGIDLPQDPPTPFVGIRPKGNSSCHRDIYSTLSIAPLFMIARDWEQPRYPSTEKWIKKMWYIYKMEYFSGILYKNNTIKFAGKYMELEENHPR